MDLWHCRWVDKKWEWTVSRNKPPLNHFERETSALSITLGVANFIRPLQDTHHTPVFVSAFARSIFPSSDLSHHSDFSLYLFRILCFDKFSGTKRGREGRDRAVVDLRNMERTKRGGRECIFLRTLRLRTDERTRGA